MRHGESLQMIRDDHGKNVSMGIGCRGWGHRSGSGADRRTCTYCRTRPKGCTYILDLRLTTCGVPGVWTTGWSIWTCFRDREKSRHGLERSKGAKRVLTQVKVQKAGGREKLIRSNRICIPWLVVPPPTSLSSQTLFFTAPHFHPRDGQASHSAARAAGARTRP